MKKILIFLVLQVFAVQAFAADFPVFPMSVWGNVKDSKGVNIPVGSVVSFYSSGSLISTFTVEKAGQYGGATAFEKSVTLNEFTGSLSIKVITGGNTYSVSQSDMDDSNNSGSSCPSKSSITFYSGVCKYDINLNTKVSLGGGEIIHAGKATFFSTGSISSGGSMALGNTSVTINSFEGDENYLAGSLVLSSITSIAVSGGAWDGILIPPTLITSGASENATTQKLANILPQNTSNTVLQTIKVGGESGVSLIANGSNFKVNFVVSNSNAGAILKLYRSVDGNNWEINSPDSTCTLDSSKICTFYTNHLSFFAPVLSVASSNSGGSSGGSGGGSVSGSYIAASVSSGSTSNTGSVSNSGNINQNTGTNSSDETESESETRNIFKDIYSSFAKEDILNLYREGIIKGFPDGTFKPDNSTTRAEFLAMVMKSFNIDISSDLSSNYFNDVLDNSWMTPYIITAFDLSIMKGQEITYNKANLSRIGDILNIGTIRINDKKDSVAVIQNILKNEGSYNGQVTGIFDNQTANAINSFVYKKTKNWYSYLSLTGAKLKVFLNISVYMKNGDNVKGKIFRPNDSITRAEAVAVLLNAAKIEVPDVNKTSFRDISDSSWIAKYVEKAKELGIISAQLKFRPNDPITRAETSRIITKTMDHF